MEFTVRRDGFYMAEEEKQEEPSTKNYAASFFPNLAPPISPSSSTSAAGFLWRVGPADGGGAGGGAGAGDHGRGESDNNFFAEKEHMFDKVVTPSDVGKLNRLVIPKQHAEKYFPLDPTSNEKGMLLSFEDRTGKSWRFRYSYWNSSQSYVMTKGWSRFVKEKRLDAGDVVSFGRGLGEPGRDQLYIDWKRRPDNHDLPRMSRLPLAGVSMARSFGPWNGGGGRFFNIPPPPSYHQHHRQGFGGAPGGGGQFLYFGPSMAGPPQIGVQHGGGGGGGSGSTPMVLNSMPLVRNQAAAKRVRLFGVNLDCPESDGNARFLSGASASAAWSPASPALPFLPFANGGTRAPSSPASSLSSKEQHLTLDLDL